MSEGNAQIVSPVPAVLVEQIKVDEEQQERIQAFLRTSRLTGSVMLVPMMVVEVFTLLWLLPPLFIGIMESSLLALQPVPGWYPLRILAIYLCVALCCGTILFPIYFVMSYLLPRRYKLRRYTFSTWISTWLRSIGRVGVNWLCLTECFLLIFVLQPNLWWLWMAVLLAFISVVRTYFSPLYAFGRLKRTPLTDEHLVRMLNDLCIKHKTHIHHFFLLESKKPGQMVRANAYLAGWGKTSSILLPDGLLKQFQPAEIKSIIAHELGHHVYWHIGKKQWLNFGLWLAELFLYYTGSHWLLSADIASSSISFVVLFTAFLGFIVVGLRISFSVARRRYSYHHEFWADEFALNATRDVSAFKNAMLRVGNLNNTPFKLSPRQEKGRTHPTTMNRLQHADEFAVRLAQARAAHQLERIARQQA